MCMTRLARSVEEHYRPARLLITTPWSDNGPLEEGLLAEGATYEIEYVAQEPLEIQEVIVQDFTLLEISTENQRDIPTVTSIDGEDRRYQLEEAFRIPVGKCIKLQLWNNTGAAKKAYYATILFEDGRV